MTSLEDYLQKTLAYSDHFSFPLTESELHSRLIRVKTTTKQLRSALNSLVSTKQIFHANPYYHLPGHEHLPSLRKERTSYSSSLFQLAVTQAHHLGRLPGVLAVYLTGSLAVANATSSDDIDLMIITKPGVLWSTRLLLTIYTTLLRLRRTPSAKRASGKLCLNLYLEPKSFTLPDTRRSLYTAYELIQAVPLYDPENTHQELLSANAWLSDFLPNFPLPHSLSTIHHPRSTIQKLIEYLAFRLQYLYMKRRITRELITPHSAFFHPHDPSTKLLTKLAL